MMSDEKIIKQVQIDATKTTQEKAKTHHRDVDFLTEVLACMAWTTKG